MTRKKVVVEGILTGHWCAFETGLDGHKLDGKWLDDVVIAKLFDDAPEAIPDEDRYEFTVIYGKVRITVERLEENE